MRDRTDSLQKTISNEKINPERKEDGKEAEDSLPIPFNLAASYPNKAGGARKEMPSTAHNRRRCTSDGVFNAHKSNPMNGANESKEGKEEVMNEERKKMVSTSTSV